MFCDFNASRWELELPNDTTVLLSHCNIGQISKARTQIEWDFNIRCSRHVGVQNDIDTGGDVTKHNLLIIGERRNESVHKYSLAWVLNIKTIQATAKQKA